MIISYSYTYFVYGVSLFLFFNFSNPLLFWLMMELNLLCFVLILFMNKEVYSKKDSSSYMIYYFLIQSSASILFLSNFSLGDWGSIFNSDAMFMISMILKLGLFPFFFWMFSLGDVLSFSSMFLLLTVQKLPLLSLFYFSNLDIFFNFLIFSFISGSILLVFSYSLTYILISSSISYSFMLMFLFSFSMNLFLSFFLFYSIFLGLLLYSEFSPRAKSGNTLLIWYASFMLGIPPLSLFFFKLVLSMEMASLLGFSEMLLFWLFSFLGLLGYIKFFHYFFFSKNSLYSNKNFSSVKMSILTLVLGFFGMFLL